jgi:hypothetical protein
LPHQSLPVPRRKADAEAAHHFVRDAPVGKVGTRHAPFRRRPQLRGEKLGGDFVQLHQRRPQLGVGVVGFLACPLLDVNSHLLCCAPQRFRKREAIHQHHKLEDVAPHAAAKTVEDLLDRMHAERGGLLLMEWAQSP